MRIKLIISGGGTRGIYQVGVFHALEELGLLQHVVSVSGCSIGAINAALFLQYPVDEIKNVWHQFAQYPFFRNVDHNSRLYPLQLMKETIIHKGLETDTLRGILSSNIDEKTILNHHIEYVISAFNVTQKRAQYFTQSTIPDTQLISHIMASARLPIFQPEVIDGDVYLDGGVVDNEPHISYLEDSSFDFLIRIKTVHVSTYLYPLRKSNIQWDRELIICPSGKLGFPLNFKNPSFDERYEMGYNDGLAVLAK